MILKNKVVLITGSTTGIGKATALLFAQYGAKIVINFHQDLKQASNTVAEIEKMGTKALSVKADVSNPSEVKQLFSTVQDSFGTLNILINNAGLARSISFQDIKPVIQLNK